MTMLRDCDDGGLPPALRYFVLSKTAGDQWIAFPCATRSAADKVAESLAAQNIACYVCETKDYSL